MWLVAGPNGSGKSTLVASDQVRPFVSDAEFVNPDEIAARLAAQDGTPLTPAIELAAAVAAEARVDACIEEGISFLVETVLSSDKYVERVERARNNGFVIGLIFVCSASPDQTVERVAQRVRLGGHDVPPEKARARWHRAVKNLERFATACDVGFVFDNSRFGETPLLVARRDGTGWLRILPCQIPELNTVIDAICRPDQG
jgi:predicted ABC-type ATPase